MAHLLAALEARLDTEVKIADGAANLLRVFDAVQAAPGGPSAAASSSSSPAPAAASRPERPRRRIPRSAARPSSSGSAASSGRGSPPASSGSVPDSDADGGTAPGDGQPAAGKEALRLQVQRELDNANARIAGLVRQIDELKMRDSPTFSTGPSGSDASYGFPTPLPVSSPLLDDSSGGLGLRSPRGSAFALHSAPDTPFTPATGGLGILDAYELAPDDAQTADGPSDEAFLARSRAVALVDTLRSLGRDTEKRILPDASHMARSPPDAVPVSPPTKHMGPPAAPSTTRSAQRARAAAQTKGESTHGRTPSHVAGLGDLPRRRIETLLQLTAVLQRHPRVRYELAPEDIVGVLLPCLADGAGKEVRAAAYRTLRHALVRPPWALVQHARDRGLDLYLMSTLLRDNRFESEREQALKLIRAIMTAGAEPGVNGSGSPPSHPDLISPGTVRALVSCAEHTNDKLRHLALQTLTELAVLDTVLLVRGGALGLVLHAVTDGPPELAPAIAQCVLLLADMPATRCFFQAGNDIETALSGFTDAPAVTGLAYADLLRTTSSVILVMLRSWTGLLYLCINGRHAIRSLVLALRVNSNEVRTAILDVLYEAFSVASQTALPVKVSADTVTGSSHQRFPLTGAQRDQSSGSTPRLNLLYDYLALLLVIFVDAGLVDAIVHVLESAPELARPAALLMGEILHLANRLLPRTFFHSARIHAMPHLFAMASRFGISEERQRATGALAAIDLQARKRNRDRAAARDGRTMLARDAPLGATGATIDRPTEKAKLKVNMQIDDTVFRNSLVETQVLNTRDHTRWNFDRLIELLEGPLMNPRRLEEASRGSKFMRRLLAFFQPFSMRFSAIPRTAANWKYVRLGCVTFTTLLSSPDGVRFLGENKLLRELRDCLEQLLPYASGAATNSSELILSRNRVAETLSNGYFEMLGVLTRSPDGMALLERAQLPTALYSVSELRSRDDLMRLLVETFDYSFDGHCRILLSKVLTSTYEPMRLFATGHLAKLLQRYPDANSWVVRLLLTQLYDPSAEVRELAASIVKDACSSSGVLEAVVAMRPVLEHLGESGHPLLLMFLSTRIGLRYLLDAGYIEREMDSWFHYRNLRYTIQLEVLLARALNPRRATDDARLAQEFDGVVPSHFYGELAKTREGCEVLRRKGHFAEFARFIRQHCRESADVEILAKLKSVLWAVGNVGSTSDGFAFLEEESLLPVIVETAEQSSVLSLKGTCFFVIGLLSSTVQGAESLHDYGWEATSNPLGISLGICLPSDLAAFVTIPPWTVRRDSHLRYLDFAEPESRVDRSIMLCVANLGNSIQANKASRALGKLKTRYPAAFEDPALICRTVEVLESHHYRQPVRRYVFELFDLRVDEDCVERLAAARSRLLARRRDMPTSTSSEQQAAASSSSALLLHEEQAAEPDDGLDDLVSQVSMSDDEDAGDRALGADRIDDYGLELGPGAPKAEMLARTVLIPQQTLKGGFEPAEAAPPPEDHSRFSRQLPVPSLPFGRERRSVILT